MPVDQQADQHLVKEQTQLLLVLQQELRDNYLNVLQLVQVQDNLIKGLMLQEVVILLLLVIMQAILLKLVIVLLSDPEQDN